MQVSVAEWYPLWPFAGFVLFRPKFKSSANWFPPASYIWIWIILIFLNLSGGVSVN